MKEIDWESQWAIHGHHFRNGFVHVELLNQEIKLKPGPGFGDLSHPTTQLVLEMMKPHVAGSTVLDIGSGSGILSLSALALGAKQAIGIDIDPEAIAHAQINAQINGMEQNAHFCLPEEMPPCEIGIILMNMIRTEQEIAWKSLKLHPKLCITSGVLDEEKDIYLEQIKAWGFQIQRICKKENWLGFALTHF